MRVATARALFLRAFWWLVFVALGLVAIPYAFMRPPHEWLGNTIGRLLILFVCALICRIAAQRWPDQAVSVLLLLFIGASPLFVGQQFNAFSLLAVTNLPLVLLCLLWGWYGAALGICVALIGLASRTTKLDEFMIAGVLLFGSGLIGAFLHRLTTVLDQVNGQLEANNERLARSASTDAMTGIGNRRALTEEFETRNQHQPLLLTLWDLNNLKQINDQQGHAAGDAFLLEFVAILQTHSRSEDRFYRVGGDEFVGLHPNLSDGRIVRDRILKRFEDVSVGWALVNGRSLEVTMNQADKAMYEQKAKSKTGVFEKVQPN
jgi:diguanylate cyclase (GGDEF)-like protein